MQQLLQALDLFQLLLHSQTKVHDISDIGKIVKDSSTNDRYMMIEHSPAKFLKIITPNDVSVVSALSFGIRSSNSATENDTAFSAMCTQLLSSSMGKSVHFPAGEYRTASGWTLLNNMHISGDRGTKLIATNREINVLNLGHGCIIDCVEIVGDGGTTAIDYTKNCGIYGSGKNNITISNCHINKCEIAGIKLEGCNDIQIIGNKLFANQWGITNSCSDIMLSSPGPSYGQRTIIANNLCLSNNSQGIFVSGAGYDREVAIVGNICVTLDPTTCIDGGSWSEIASGSLLRRHGIMVGYVANVEGPRVTVTANICRNTNNTGIYHPSHTAFGSIIAANICSKNGVNNAELAGAIYVTGQHTIVANNIIEDFRSNNVGAGAIVVQGTNDDYSTDIQVLNNRITLSQGNGIILLQYASRCIIRGNVIHDCAKYGLVWSAYGSGDLTLTGGHTIESNVLRSAGIAGMWLQPVADSLPSNVRFNEIIRTSAGAAANTNAGVLVQSLIEKINITDNTIQGWHFGICTPNYCTTARHFDDMRIERNRFVDLTYGVGIPALDYANVIPVVDCTFVNVITKVYGIIGIMPNTCWLCTREGDRLVLLGYDAVPTNPINGTWLVGDRMTFLTPTSGGFIGAVCTTAGSPGTWKNYGAIA